MHNLVINSKLTPSIIDHKDADATTAVRERVVQSRPQSTLVQHAQTLLDIASLGHGNDASVIAKVQDTILLEDRAEHVLDNDTWRWVADEGRLFLKLFGEEINA